MTANIQNGPGLLIPFESFEDHLHCSICLSVIRGAVLTPCGHRYCSKCIIEWVGRNHTCPCCNNNLNTGQLYYDVQYDSLIEEILKARDNAEEAHFEKMFFEGTSDTTENHQSPFQEIFKKHVKESFLSFERYFHKLYEDHTRQIRILEASLELGPNENNGLSKEDKRKALEEKLKISEKLAMESFDRYLTTNIPQFEVLPVTVSVYIIDKNIRISNVVIQPKDSVTAIKSSIETAMDQRQDSIVNWADKGDMLFLVGPLAKREEYELENLLNGSISNVLLSWHSLPVFENNLLPGSEIILHGAFKLQSDQPKQCFVQVFQKTGNLSVDYFSCQTCNVKWICKSCSQACHAGHALSPFALNHTPTWACCYCPKKKLCTLINNVKESQ